MLYKVLYFVNLYCLLHQSLTDRKAGRTIRFEPILSRGNIVKMSVDSFERGFGYGSNDLVARMAWDQAERLGMADGSPTLAVTLGYPDAASESYALQTLHHGQLLATPTRDNGQPPVKLYVPTNNGFDVIRTPDDFRAAREQGLYTPVTETERRSQDEMLVGLTQDLNADSNITGQLHLFRTATPEGEQRVRETISPYKDPDGVSVNRLVTPATPEAQVTLAEYILGTTIDRVEPRTIAIVGNGKLVGGPLFQEVLPNRGVDNSELGMVLGSRKEIDEGLPCIKDNDIQLIFTAIPVAARLRLEHVRPEGLTIIDAGYAINPETGLPGGNVHPELLALNGLHLNNSLQPNAITSFRNGVGPVTTAIIFDRSLPPGQGSDHSPRRDRGLAVVGA
jgi:5,10-methylene-tetrahydrofolate dehydrogenase/methenyl tetrahydrofolate cyclohydrolase